jgi:hypothetical protein
MPIRHCIVHLIDKKPDGTPAVLHARDSELAESAAIENMLADLNESYNAKQGKAWGFFHAESGAHPFSGWLKEYFDGGQDFTTFSRTAVEHLQKLMEESNLSTGGHVLFAHYQQGMTDYLAIALLHHSEGVAVTDELDVTPSRHLDLGQLHLAARINVSEWQNNKQSKQYISFIKGKNGKKVSEYFRDFIGCQEGVDGPGEVAPAQLAEKIDEFLIECGLRGEDDVATECCPEFLVRDPGGVRLRLHDGEDHVAEEDHIRPEPREKRRLARFEVEHGVESVDAEVVAMRPARRARAAVLDPAEVRFALPGTIGQFGAGRDVLGQFGRVGREVEDDPVHPRPHGRDADVADKGEGYVRFALVENEHRIRQAIRQIRRALTRETPLKP